MKLSPLVNTETPMDNDLFDALCHHETVCAMEQKDVTDETSVRQFLTKIYNRELANLCHPEQINKHENAWQQGRTYRSRFQTIC